jgi:Putative MetA-pathway of phenol degradation
MLLKYRLLGADQAHGNYALSFALATTLPTGSYKNGSLRSTVTPTMFAGKGFGKFDVQSSLGVTFPTGDTAKQGRTMVWNTAAQYHIGKLFWPEVEDNASFFLGGPRNGLMQNFLTPGLVVSKFKLEKDPQNRLAVMFGGGMQIATSGFHTFNHGLVLTARMLF